MGATAACCSLLVLVLVLPCSEAGAGQPRHPSLALNTTQATGWVSLAALALLLAATGLYLANYYSTAARSDSVPQYDPYGNYDPSYSYSRRSSDMGYDFNAVNILQWISMLQEVYEKFDYND